MESGIARRARPGRAMLCLSRDEANHRSGGVGYRRKPRHPGQPARSEQHDANPSPLVKRAVQALAIDEHRRDFTPTFWHESSSGLFALDRYHPTLREIGMKKCPVKLNESLYEAMDEAGKPISTINESVHKSVLARYAAPAQVCFDDLNGSCSLAPYRPKTLTPFYSSGVLAGLLAVD
jgi:hypothetical protein